MNGNTNPNGGFAPNGQTPQNNGNSSFQMTGGTLTSLYPAVVFIVRREANELHMCTGTFVGPNTIFTAAHCVDSTLDGGVSILTGTSYNPQNLIQGFHTNIFAKQVFYANDPANYANSLDSNDPEDQAVDFAIIITQNENAAPAIAPIQEYRPELNKEFSAVMVGYGKDESGRVGNKRMGNARLELYKTSSANQAFANAQSGASAAQVAEGDSGGGVFIGNDLIGVTTNANNVSIPVWSPAIQSTISSAKAAGAIIGQKINAPTASASVFSNGQIPTNNQNINCR